MSPQINQVKIHNFRNIIFANVNFSPSFNLIIGNNAEGKTNFLESISLICSLKPMNSLNNNDLIKHGEQKSNLIANFVNSPCSEVAIEILPLGKRVFLNQKAIKNSNLLSKNFSIVSFVPQELNMISGSASLRRKVLDQACISLFSTHQLSIKNYEKILSQRNMVLKTFPLNLALLETFSSMLIKEAVIIIYNRLRAIEILMPFFKQKMNEIFSINNYFINYLIGEQSYIKISQEEILELLNKTKILKHKQEIIRRTTLFGPHLDDIEFMINNLSAQKSCSRGQARSLVLSFKLAQMIAIKNIKQCSPIIILDDIISELDNEKKNNLINVIYELESQAFFSATDQQAFINKEHAIQIFKVKSGEIFI